MKILTPLLILSLVTTGAGVYATQTPQWNVGKIQLVGGDILEGDVNFDWDTEVVQFHQNSTIRAYSAQQVISLVYFDAQLNILRTFVTVTNPLTTKQDHPELIEQVTKGTLTVYRRLHHIRGLLRWLGFKSSRGTIDPAQSIDSFDYFVFDGYSIIQMHDFPSMLWPLMNNEFGDELHRYMQANKMSLYDTISQIQLINKFNYLKISMALAGKSSVSVGH